MHGIPPNKRTRPLVPAPLDAADTIQITAEMVAVADNAAQQATEGATEAYRREAMGKVHQHLRSMRIALERLDQRVDEIDKRLESCSNRVSTYEAEWQQMRERWEGMLRYCYRVCKADQVKALAGMEPTNSDIIPQRPWHGSKPSPSTPIADGRGKCNLFDEPLPEL